ncbi:MAG: hypothetical protein Q9159_003455 [Coniocarpon cinnabarinum]
MPQLIKSFPAGPYHLAIFIAIVWRLYYVLSGPSFSIAACSLLWLVFRLHRVLCQPIDDLIAILGIEVPSPPFVSLLGICEDTVSVRWHASEKFSSTKYSVCVNGATVGELSPQENAISITGLAAGVYYTIRVTACTHGKFLAESDPIRVQTPPLDVDDEDDEDEERIAHTTIPAVVPYRGQYEGLAVPSPVSPLPLREHSVTLSQPKRRASIRKSSPNPNLGQWERRQSDQSGDQSSNEDVRNLTARLDELRREQAEQTRLDDEEEAQYQQEMQSLTERRDELRREAKEKEDTSKDLKKSVATLERQNQAAIQKRLHQEKALDAKQNERRKVQEDIERWDAESIALQEEMDAMKIEQAQLVEERDHELERIRIEREPHEDTVRGLEEQVRIAGIQARELEEGRKDTSEPTDSPQAPESELNLDEEGRSRQERILQMQEELRRKIFEVQQGKQYMTQLNARLQAMTVQQRVPQNTYDPNAAEFTPASQAPYTHTRDTERRASSADYGNAFASSALPDARNVFHSSVHPNIDLGGFSSNQVYDESTVRGPPTQAELHRLTGGALASPGARNLLPSGLLGDEADDPTRRHQQRHSIQESDSVGSRTSSTAPPPGFEYHRALRETSDPLPGLGTVPGLGSSAALNQQRGPQSPVADDSRSPSLTSSPHDSFYFKPSESIFDSDRRSIRSTSSSSRALGAARPSRFLGDVINRQRGRSTTDDGPALGSLRTSESQSFPIENSNESGDAGPALAQRRAHGGLFSSMFSRRAPGPSRLTNGRDEGLHTQQSGPDELRRLRSGGFPWSNSSFDTGLASRPTSVYSAENALPRPGGDIQQPFGWNASGIGRSNTTASGRQRMHAWSLSNSRRGSSQVDAPMLSEFDDEEDDVLPLADKNTSAAQAPIGTKPSKSKKKEEKLPNPYTSGFMGGVFSRDRKADKQKERSLNPLDTLEAETDDLGIAGAPQLHEPSIHSITESGEDVRSASPRASESGPSTPAEATPNSRESFMRKLTRKGSHIPGLKSRKTTAPNTPQPNVDDTDDGDTTAGQIVRTPSSVTNSPQVSHEKEKDKEKDSITKRSSGFSLNSFKRRGRKDKDAPSVSETSMNSGTGDEAVASEMSERPSTDD